MPLTAAEIHSRCLQQLFAGRKQSRAGRKWRANASANSIWASQAAMECRRRSQSYCKWSESRATRATNIQPLEQYSTLDAIMEWFSVFIFTHGYF
jgi:hypothetical protein